MKIIDAIKHSGRPFEIPDASRNDLPAFFIELGFKVGVEIGVNKGEYTEKFAQAGLDIYGVDPWVWDKEYDSSRTQEHYDNIYEQAKTRLTPYSNITIIRKTSMEAAKDFKDESLDFVYIDGNHKLKYVIEDIVEWSKKIKPGGIISGHDYVRFKPKTETGICHVIPAVNAYTQAYEINNWYVIGRKKAPQGEKRDRWRSWMFIKK